MRVYTSTDLDYGVIFGPIVVHSALLNPSRLIGLLTEEKRNETTDTYISVDLLEMSGRNPSLEWLVCIPSARNEDEQNMEAYSKDGRVFYRTLRIIRAGEPLYVWYSKDFCQLLQIHVPKRCTSQEQEQFICTSCGEVFQFEFSFMAHKRFKCEELTLSDFKEIETKIKEELEIIKSKIQEIQSILEREKAPLSSKTFSKTEKRQSTETGNAQGDYSVKLRIISGQTVKGSFSDASAFRKVELQKRIIPPCSSSFSSKYLKMSEPQDVNIHLHGVRLHGQSMTSVSSDQLQNARMHFPISRHDPQDVSPSPGMTAVSDPWKQYFLSERLNAGIPFMKSSNPMVEKILHNASPVSVTSPMNAMVLSQNWCAKCNASFRMTSDLVYHMRSHHKREFDPVKKKRDDKLRCNICQETFRERHHLTRHMTSHA